MISSPCLYGSYKVYAQISIKFLERQGNSSRSELKNLNIEISVHLLRKTKVQDVGNASSWSG